MIRSLFILIAILIIANVAVLLWPDSVNTAPHIYSVKKELNPHFVRLNKEIEERFYSQVGAEAVVATTTAAPEPVQGDSSGCYRVGPFVHQPNYELAQAVLFNAGVEYRKSKRVSKESSVFRVFLGPYDTSAEAADVRVELKRQKVLDHFVRKQGQQFIVSLGIYSSLESVDTAVSLFQEKLGPVNKQSENIVLPESFWLHFSVSGNDRVREQLSVMDWGETAAKMGLFGCESEL